MSLNVLAGVKAFGNDHTTRKVLVAKLKNAISLVVVRGPIVTRNEKGEDVVVFSGKPNPDLILRGTSGLQVLGCQLTCS